VTVVGVFVRFRAPLQLEIRSFSPRRLIARLLVTSKVNLHSLNKVVQEIFLLLNFFPNFACASSQYVVPNVSITSLKAEPSIAGRLRNVAVPGRHYGHSFFAITFGLSFESSERRHLDLRHFLASLTDLHSMSTERSTCPYVRDR
jgi:hypothetical protein